MLGASLVADEPNVLPHRPETWVAMAYRVVIGSVVVSCCSRSNEPVSVALVLSGLLVLAGVYVGALRPARAHSAVVDEKTDIGRSTCR